MRNHSAPEAGRERNSDTDTRTGADDDDSTDLVADLIDSYGLSDNVRALARANPDAARRAIVRALSGGSLLVSADRLGSGERRLSAARRLRAGAVPPRRDSGLSDEASVGCDGVCRMTGARCVAQMPGACWSGLPA